MKEKGLSIRTLAHEVDISSEHIRKAVRGDSIPSDRILKIICQALVLPFEEFKKLAKIDKFHREYGSVLPEIADKKPGMQPIEDVWDILTKEHQHDLVAMAQRWASQNREKKEVLTD